MKNCSNEHCTENNPQPFGNFHKHNNTSDGLATRCRKCHSIANKKYREQNKERLKAYKEQNRKEAADSALKRRYGITLEQYLFLLKKQNNLCAICKEAETRIDYKTNKISQLCVDHCHITGKIRGLLCFSCNIGIGKFKDDPEKLNRAANYVKGTN